MCASIKALAIMCRLGFYPFLQNRTFNTMILMIHSLSLTWKSVLQCCRSENYPKQNSFSCSMQVIILLLFNHLSMGGSGPPYGARKQCKTLRVGWADSENPCANMKCRSTFCVNCKKQIYEQLNLIMSLFQFPDQHWPNGPCNFCLRLFVKLLYE